MKAEGYLTYFSEQGMEGNAVLSIDTNAPEEQSSYDKILDVGLFDYINVYKTLSKLPDKKELVYCGPVYFSRIYFRCNFQGPLLGHNLVVTDKAKEAQAVFGESITEIPQNIKCRNPFVSINEWIELFHNCFWAEAWTENPPAEQNLLYSKQGHIIQGYYNYLGT